MTDVRDVIIIGSGPAGYAAAIYAARAQLAPLVFEGSVTAGGALMNTTEVENYPGFSAGISGPDLMVEMRAQAERFGAELLAADVTDVQLIGARIDSLRGRNARLKRITDGSGAVHLSRAVILATGSGYRTLDLPDEHRLSGRGVSWCATCDGFFFQGQEIAVVGGGDSAIEEATFLTRFASRVHLIHRRNELRASKIMQQRAFNNPKLDVIWNAEVIALHGDDTLSGVTLTDTVTGDARELPVTGLFIAIGHEPRSELLVGQVDLDESGYVVVEHPTTHTSQPGVFACGDLVDQRYRQAITAAGTGAAAALDAELYLAELGDAGFPSDIVSRTPIETRAAPTVPGVREVTDETFEAAVLQSSKPVLVDFWAEWCGPCKQIAPILADLSAKHGERVEFVKVNVDQNRDTAMSSRVISIPTMNLYHNGKVMKQLIGAQSRSAIVEVLAEFL